MSTATRVRAAATATALATAMTLAGCSDDPVASGRTDDPGVRGRTDEPATAPTSPEDTMQLDITIGQQHFIATLDESAAAQDLLAQLPVTLDMVDHGGVEKTGPLPQPLSLEGQPDGADPAVGDLGYYAPGNDLVLYYGDQSYFAGIVVLGRLDDDAATRIAALDGAVTATVRAR
ncbi:conserved exported hypothetical protein [metagenome]|uniref:Cyclophilin-like domain-containing protein n=1 Tax=metagenome TaxID=256318 RepID=A0A2P2CKZ4_9ZZZZ